MIIRKSAQNSADLTSKALREGRLAILPTDTIYGFSGIVPDSNALIVRAKGRDEGKPFIELISDPAELSRYAIDAIQPRLIALWPGAITIIVNVASGGTQAFRCPGDAWLREVIAAVGKPIYSTSVNRAGEPPLKTMAEIRESFGDVDLIVDSGDFPNAVASTIVDATGSEYRIVRQGAVTIPPECLVKP
jgi:L-threonylcarbamoyladenylate synthase